MKSSGSKKQKLRSNMSNSVVPSDTQLIKSLIKKPPESSIGKLKAAEADHNMAEEGLYQREIMLNDPRFGSPLLCDLVVMIMALLPIFCGLVGFFYTGSGQGETEGYRYGLVLCGIFIFLLGLRSASIHLTNQHDTTEEHVLYILDKFGGSMCIPKLPDAVQRPDGDSGGMKRDTSQLISDSSQATEDVVKLVVDQATATLYQLKNNQ